MSDDASRKDRRIIGKEARPQHDQPCKRIPYAPEQELFAVLISEVKDG